MRGGLLVSFVFICLLFVLSLVVGISYDNFDTGLKNGLVSYYNMDETSGTTATDVHGSNDGTITGAAVNQTGHIGTAYDFDGVDDYIDTGLILPTNNVSISFWMKTDTRTGRPTPIGNSVDGTSMNKGIQIHFSSSTNLRMVRREIDGAELDVTVPDDSLWHHLVFVASANGMFGYVDGSLNDSLTTSVAKTDFNNGVAFTTGLHIGGWYGGSTLHNDFDGKIDEVGIWNRTLSSSEVLEIYNLSKEVEILEIIPIQVVEDVDLVLGKTTLVRTVIKNPAVGSKNVNVSLYFDGVYQKSNVTETIAGGETKDVDLMFVPGSAGIGKEIKIEVEEII